MKLTSFCGILRYKQITSSRLEDQPTKKENLLNNGLCYSGWPQGKTERKWKDKYLDLARELKKLWNMKVMGIPIVVCAPQRICKETGRLGNKRINGDHPDNSISKISQNTEKSPGDTRKLAFAQTPVRNHQLTLVWKTLKGVK